MTHTARSSPVASSRLSRSLFAGLSLALLGGLVPPLAVAALWWSVAATTAPGLLLAGAVCLAQFGLQLVLLRRFFERRIGAPLATLEHEAEVLAEGRFDAPTQVGGGDEIGRLAAALDRMRRALGDRLAERQALFDNTPVGILFVRNRVIELANGRAETLLGAAPGRLEGRPTEIIYRSRGEFLDVGARAYGVIERGEVFAETLQLAVPGGKTFRAVLAGCALDPGAPQDGSIWSIQPLPAGA